MTLTQSNMLGAAERPKRPTADYRRHSGIDIYTSNFAQHRTARIQQAGLRPIAIARGVPQGFDGTIRRDLAPSWTEMNAERSDFDRSFRARLAALDAEAILTQLDLNNGPVCLLCWEAPHTYCHRRYVAEWLEQATGLIIPEFGFDRDACASANTLIEPNPKKPPTSGKSGLVYDRPSR
jgi:hypothetical protein